LIKRVKPCQYFSIIAAYSSYNEPKIIVQSQGSQHPFL
jgi:hypothetical protein